MKIESEKIKLLAFDPKILGVALQPEQQEILSLFQKNHSILEVVQKFFSQKKLVSFLSILYVIRLLLAKKLIQNPTFYQYFQASSLISESAFAKLPEAVSNSGKIIDPEKLKKIPFLRSLNPELINVLLAQASVQDVPAGLVFCQEGAQQRSMLILLSGQASVYKKNKEGEQIKQVVLNEGSLFGEAAFFFGVPRTATVVADVNSKIVIIKYVPEVFDGFIKTEKAHMLQMRIWAVHALLKSDLFKNLPQECFDALIFAGDLKSFNTNEVICRQGEIGETCYILVQGKMAVTKDDKLIKKFDQGDCFGELALLVSNGKRTATVKSESPGIFLEIHRDRFYKMMAENLLLACEFEKLAKQRMRS